MRTTIKDIASRTGLSITTVSLVLNGKGEKISASTRELVLSAAREMHYRPNQLAVSLVKRHTKTLGVVLPDITNSFFSFLIKAVEDEAAQHGYHLILCHSSDKKERDIENIHMLLDKAVDGIILLSSIGSTTQDIENACMIATENGVPVVLIDRVAQIAGICSVSLDNRAGGYMGMRHLLDHGHRRIGILTGPKASPITQERLKGAEKALLEEGLSLANCQVYEGDYHFDSGILAADYFLHTGVSAVFSFNDSMALSLISRALEFSVRIPQELSVMGFDDIAYSRLLNVPLTTIRQPVHEMGVCAAQMLIDQSEQDSQVQHRTFKPSLVVRASTAPYTGAAVKKQEQ